jgi:hypothetical protein
MWLADTGPVAGSADLMGRMRVQEALSPVPYKFHAKTPQGSLTNIDLAVLKWHVGFCEITNLGP